jgi:hypothetical protein
LEVIDHDDRWPCQNDEQAAVLWRDVFTLLQTIPETWAEFDRDAQTDAQSKALYMLVAAGFVERRGWLRVKFAGHPSFFEVRYRATGEAGMGQALASAVSAMFSAWEDAWKQWRAGEAASGVPFATESLKPQEWRLISEGVLARSHLETEAVGVIEFVLKLGRYGPGYRHRTFFLAPPSPAEFMAIAERMKAGEDIGKDTRPPVYGAGVLVEIRETTRPAEQTNVAVVNWADGADAFAKALGPMFAALAQKHAEELAKAGPAIGAEKDQKTPAGFMGVAELAKVFGVPPENMDGFNKRMERERRSLGDGAFEEVQNPRPNAPRFLYNAGHPRVREIAAEYGS